MLGQADIIETDFGSKRPSKVPGMSYTLFRFQLILANFEPIREAIRTLFFSPYYASALPRRLISRSLGWNYSVLAHEYKKSVLVRCTKDVFTCICIHHACAGFTFLLWGVRRASVVVMCTSTAVLFSKVTAVYTAPWYLCAPPRIEVVSRFGTAR